jgi:hypothetical protein
MFGLGFIIIVVLIAGGFFYWARQQGLLTNEPAVAGRQGTRRISLLTEAMAYVGAILLLAGGIAAIGQRWNDMADWMQVSVFAGAAAFFLVVGVAVHRVREPAIQRLVGVVWFLSVAGVAGAVGLATREPDGTTSTFTVLAVGLAVSGYSAALWLVRRQALQNVALFAGLVATICGTIVAVADPAPALAFALALWGFGLAWAVLGWQQYVQPMWVALACGAVLALVAPSFAIGDHGWLYAIGIATAATAMATSVPLRNTPLLALGTLTMFGYVTSAVVQYFGESLGAPAALAITGALIIGLAVVTARLMRAAHRSAPTESDAGKPLAPPAEATAPPVEQPSRRDLSRTS